MTVLLPKTILVLVVVSDPVSAHLVKPDLVVVAGLVAWPAVVVLVLLVLVLVLVVLVVWDLVVVLVVSDPLLTWCW